jgi:SAM-dependent methyltransferase
MKPTIWEKIYQSYKNSEQKWASLEDDLLPDFLKFVENSKFEIKNVLDIGCGDGRYLEYLKKAGFKIAGIDSSKTAIELARKNLGNEFDLICAEMFKHDLPADEYDLIYSISSIHHGFKKDVSKLVEKIYDSLVMGGFAFITLPDINDIKSWNTFKNHKELGAGTFAPLTGPEIGLAHSFFDKKEIEKMFSKFSSYEIYLNERVNWIIIVRK